MKLTRSTEAVIQREKIFLLLLMMPGTGVIGESRLLLTHEHVQKSIPQPD